MDIDQDLIDSKILQILQTQLRRIELKITQLENELSFLKSKKPEFEKAIFELNEKIRHRHDPKEKQEYSIIIIDELKDQDD